MYRLLWHIPIWILFLAFRTIMIALGWALIPIAVLFRAYEPYMGADGAGTPRLQYRFTWGFMWPWDNQEDGIALDLYYKAPNLPLQIIYWSAIRNPVNNLRYVPFLSCKIVPEKVRFIGSTVNYGDTHVANYEQLVRQYDSDEYTFWYFCWQGLYSNFRVQFNLFGRRYRAWIGWKIYPHDSFGIRPTDYRFDGAGYATQLKRIDD